MEIWSKCDICGRDIPVGELCYGLKKGNCICKYCCTGFENCTFTLAPATTLTPQNEPLTLEQLREMDGEPAWWDDGYGSCWGIISVDSAGMWGGIPFFRGRWREVNFEYNIEKRKMKIYRRPPEGEKL